MGNSHSYHIFMFPFQWRIPELAKEVFSDQIDLSKIKFAQASSWQNVVTPLTTSEKENLYNEKNYFYEFTHPVLYDTGNDNDVLKHFERREPASGNVFYNIGCKDKAYKLNVDAINLNIYSTGIGVLSFYLKNTDYPDAADVLNINQYGRRLYPPFFADIERRIETPYFLEIEGLHGSPLGYREDFKRYTPEMSNVPARFIEDMIREVATNVTIKSVIDDRMYVMSWYKNDEFVNLFKADLGLFKKNEFWYKYTFVDAGGLTCQNEEMRLSLMDKATYPRWQDSGTLYSVSRYSMQMLTSSDCPPYLLTYFETMYVRMAELVLVQRATLLRFSAEVTNISSLKRKGDSLSKRVSSLYEEYIRFVNQIHFREVSAQEQGIEVYNMLYEKACIAKEVDKLDEEIEELHNHVSLIEDRKNSKLMDWLTLIAAIFLPVTIISGFFGMNVENTSNIIYSYETLLIVVLLLFSVIGFIVIKKRINRRR